METKVNFINKQMLVVINKMVINLTLGTEMGKHNIREGQALGFVDQIFHNQLFGETLYPDLFHQAGAYMFYIIKNHIFHDGNKRTGLAAAVVFLEWNNVAFAPFDEDEVFDFVISIAGGENDPNIAIPKIANWFKSMSLL